MRFARLSYTSDHFIDVYTTSRSPLFRESLLSELEPICVPNRLSVHLDEYQEEQGKRAPEPWVSILVIDQPAPALADIEKLTTSMPGHRRLMLVLSDTWPEILSELAGTVDGFFTSKDLATLLQPIRQLTESSGLIGIDLADFLSVWKGRLTRPMRVSPGELAYSLKLASPFEGVLVSFPVSMDLQEIGDAVDALQAFLPDDCALVYHDTQTPGSELCDVGIAYPLGGDEVNVPG